MMRFKGYAATASVVAALLASAVSASATEWDLSTEYAPASLPGRVNAYFAEKVKELSDGAFNITVHYSGALGFKAADHYTAVEDGALQIASTPFNRMNGIDPIFDLQSLPFLQSNLDEAEQLDRTLRPFYNHVMHENGQFVLFTTPWTPQGFWATKPVTTTADLEGLRLRVVDLAAVRTLKEAGADAIQMSWADTLPAISTGAINGVLTSDDGGLSAQFPEAGLTAFSPVGFTVGVEMVHVNQDAFDDLSEDEQLIVLAAAADAQAHGWALARQTVDDNLAKMKEQNVQVLEIAPEFRAYLREAAGPAIASWQETFGPKSQLMLDLAAASMPK